MKANRRTVEISSRDYWFKIVDFLQQNWALVDEYPDGCKIFFFGDTSGVFDYLEFPSTLEADLALRRNGFGRFSQDDNARNFIKVPPPPFYEGSHPNGKIYSTGRFWR